MVGIELNRNEKHSEYLNKHKYIVNKIINNE